MVVANDTLEAEGADTVTSSVLAVVIEVVLKLLVITEVRTVGTVVGFRVKPLMLKAAEAAVTEMLALPVVPNAFATKAMLPCVTPVTEVLNLPSESAVPVAGVKLILPVLPTPLWARLNAA
jgi:hypothetical protein